MLMFITLQLIRNCTMKKHNWDWKGFSGALYVMMIRSVLLTINLTLDRSDSAWNHENSEHVTGR